MTSLNIPSTSSFQPLTVPKSPTSLSPRLTTSSPQIGLGLGMPKDPGGASASADVDADGKKIEITSPHELTTYVDDLLTSLESRFDAMSADVLQRLSSLSTRVDSLESSIADLMNENPGGSAEDDLTKETPP